MPQGRSFCPRGIKNKKALMTISVFLSTVLIKQHVIWDVISAVIVGELGLFLARIVRRRVQSKNNTH